ncbi:MAG TPA: TolC family protein [Vicinamibacterales bacterium]|nr:TolC family protein [Vicinamibacterales bacterium]
MRTTCAFLTTLLASASLSPAAAQQAGDQARLAEIARQAAQQFAVARVDAEQTRPTVPITAPGPSVELTLVEAEARALERNLDLAVERLNPQLQDLQLERLHATYRPTVSGTFSQRNQVQPPTSQLNGGLIVENNQGAYNTGLTQAVPWGGGDFSVNFTNQRQETNNSFSNFNPSYNSNLTASYTQPLLRDFRIDSTRQQIRVSTINREVSDIQLRRTITTTVANVRNSYWELLFASQAVEVARGSLELALKLVDDNRARVEVGTMAPLDVVQAEAEAATRRQTLAQAEATMQTAEIALKRLIVNGTEDDLWRAKITAIDRPEFRPEPLDVEAAVRRSLDNRTDVAQARKTIESNDVTMGYLKNQTLPALDLTANYSAQGVGGTRFERQGLGGSISNIIEGGYGDAMKAIVGRDYPVWQVQLNVSYPLGSSAQEAQYARARVQRNQSVAQLRALELQVAAEVTNAALQVESSLKRFEAATAARELSDTRLRAEESRFEVGLSTNFFVVQAQRDLQTAQNSELRALLDYRRALVEYERVQDAPAGGGGGITSIQGN